jgi:proteasome assembly chaperone (PAC2) family protein
MIEDGNESSIDMKYPNFRILKYMDENPSNFINPICFLGMPGLADVGKFAIDQLIGILNAQKYCEIICYDYPAGAIIDDSILSTPKAEILTYHDKKKKQDIILITSDAQAMTPKGIYEISDLIVDIIYQFNVKQIISLSSFPSRKRSPEDYQIFVTSTEEFDLKEFKGCQKLSKGVIIGANGLIPTLAKARFNVSGKVFLSETEQTNNEGFTDIKSSILLLDFIIHQYGLPVESTFSNDKVNELSNDLERKRKKLEEELDSYQSIEKIVEQDKTLYI